jgi:phenylalanyl-tRNA synthetase beta chain
VYAGKPLPPGQRSLSISFKLRAADRTLTEEEINHAVGCVMNLLRDSFAAQIRE